MTGRWRRWATLASLPVAAIVIWGLMPSPGGDLLGEARTAPTSASPSTATPPGAGRTAPSPASHLPPTSTWEPGPGEPQPEIKRAATEFLETAGTWVGTAGAAATLLAEGFTPEVAATAAPLEAPGAVASTVDVVYPQYGGIAEQSAAVITVFDQNLQMADGSTITRQLTLDLRLARGPAGDWGVVGIRPLTSLGPALPLSEAAQAVLAEPRLELSATARLDVSTGRINDQLLQVLLGLAEERVLTVQVVHTGHIQTVYPTDRLSNHAVGRAVDVRAVDGQPVVDPATSPELLTSVMVRAGELGATEVGGPFDLNGDRTGFFSDIVHQDHLHIGITPGKPLARR